MINTLKRPVLFRHRLVLTKTVNNLMSQVKEVSEIKGGLSSSVFKIKKNPSSREIAMILLPEEQNLNPCITLTSQ